MPSTMLMLTRAFGCACRPPPSSAEITSCTRVLALPLRDHEREMTPRKERCSECTVPTALPIIWHQRSKQTEMGSKQCVSQGNRPWKNRSKEDKYSWGRLPKFSLLDLKPSPKLSSYEGCSKQAREKVFWKGKDGVGFQRWGTG